MSTIMLLMVLAGGVIFGLAIYAGRLLMQLKHQRQQQNAILDAQRVQLAKHDQKVLSSVTIIVRAMKEEQCDISEGCWRLCVLLGSLKSIEPLGEKFPAIFELYESIKHLSILEDRKQLTKQQRMKQDVERMKVEGQLTAKIMEELSLLHMLTEQETRRLSAY